MNLRAIFGGALPLFVLGHFSHHILTAITVPLTPFIRSAFNLDYTQSGLVVSAFTLAYGFGQLPAGWLADRIDPRKLMIVGISGVALAGILVGLSHSYVWMIVFLVLMGILAGGYHPSAPPLISASVRPENLGRAFGFTTSAAGPAISWRRLSPWPSPTPGDGGTPMSRWGYPRSPSASHSTSFSAA